MAISSYEKDGKTYWRVYVNLRSKVDPTVREQKLVAGLKSEDAAKTEERKLLKELSSKITRTEGKGLTWEQVIERWQDAMRRNAGFFKYQPTTIQDHGSNLRRWTATWLNRPASELNRADGRDVMREMELVGKSRAFRKNIKYAISVVYRWGIEERLIPGAQATPVEGLKLTADKAEKVPDILTLEEIRKLLLEAKRLEHAWYPIWAMALLTGMRNGELHALLWTDVDLDGRKITVSKSYNTRMRSVKSTKAGYWRTVPISDELLSLLMELKATAGDRAHVLPRCWEWDKGEQARVLKAFCLGLGMRQVKFHALRACFATQLLAHDVAPARIMKICGWRDLKTMQYYVRLSGIEETGQPRYYE